MRPCSQADCNKASDAASAVSVEPEGAACERRGVIDFQWSERVGMARSDDASETALPRRPKAVAFGMDAASLADLRQALLGWRIDCFYGTTVGQMPHDWDPGEAELFVVLLRENVTAVLGLCRFLAQWPSGEDETQQDLPETWRSEGTHQQDASCGTNIPLVVLVSSGQETLVGAALEVGARACLRLPISAQDVAEFLNREAGDPFIRQGSKGTCESH
jgi:CheY-like chemotaxis protein